MPAARLRLLPTFVKPRTMRPFAERRRRICFAGRVERIKGVHVLLAAFDQLQRRGVATDVELVIAGDLDTPCGRDIQARLRRWPIRGVTLAGQLDGADVLELLESSLLSVVPSLWYENSPNSLLESLACGTPVIACDLGSMRDALQDTGAGLLCAPGRRRRPGRRHRDRPSMTRRPSRRWAVARTPSPPRATAPRPMPRRSSSCCAACASGGKPTAPSGRATLCLVSSLRGEGFRSYSGRARGAPCTSSDPIRPAVAGPGHTSWRHRRERLRRRPSSCSSWRCCSWP